MPRTVLVTQDNLWFHGPAKYEHCPFEPLIQRNSDDPRLLRQHLQLLFRYTGDRRGRNVVLAETYQQPWDFIDLTLRDDLLPILQRTGSRFCVFYAAPGSAKRRGLHEGDGPVNFARPEILEMWREDLDHLETYWTSSPSYWRIDGRPVMVLWGARTTIVNADQALEEARRRGWLIFGDVFGQNGPTPPIDGATGFVCATPNMAAQRRRWTVREALPQFAAYFSWYQRLYPYFMPATSFQYDDAPYSELIGKEPLQVLAASIDDVRAWLELVRTWITTIGDDRPFFLGTLNNYREGTTLLPTVDRQPRYLGGDGMGHYHFDHLQALDVLFESRYEGPRIAWTRTHTGRLRTVFFRDCDELARVRVAADGGELENPPDWETGQHLRWSRFLHRRTWKPRGTFSRLVVDVANLDGRTALASIERRST